MSPGKRKGNDMKATVLYYSHKGKTAFFAREIAMYLWSKGLDVSLSSISDFNAEKLSGSDFLISGCWTCGWFVIGQHPHKQWRQSSKELSKVISPHRTLFFTTYRLCTGSMLYFMKRGMAIPASASVPFLKSKSGVLTPDDKKILDRLIAGQA